MIGAYHTAIGGWDPGRKAYDESGKIDEQLREYRRWEESVGLKGSLVYYEGNYPESLEIHTRCYESAARRGDKQMTSLTLSGRARNLLRLGRLDECIALSEQAAALSAEYSSGPAKLPDDIHNYGVSPLAYRYKHYPALPS